VTPADERRGAAIHEAGHAVVAWALGLRVHWVQIGIPSDLAAGVANFDEKPSTSLIDRIALCAAGGIAERAFNAPTNGIATRDDVRKILDLLTGREELVVSGLRDIGYAKSYELLGRHRDKVTALAAALADRSALSETEIAAILGDDR
jgi:ATP-dependent Zn protease